MAAPALTLKHLGKTYPSQVALSDVSFDVAAGEVHALVGENGCGKSTLIKCLSGYHASDEGSEIQVGGVSLPPGHTPRQARDAGLAFVHQDLGLIPSLSVMENIALGRGFVRGRGWKINWSKEQRATRLLLDDLEIDVSATAVVGALSQADRTLVAITRGLRDAGDEGRLLVLDEPTAALPDAEVSRLFDFVRRLQARGLGIMYVSHRFNEIFELAQRVTVLRDTRYIGTYDIGSLDERSLVTRMIGKPLEEHLPRTHIEVSDEVVLSARELCGNRVNGASFDVRRGEIVGVAGLLGAGRSELGRLVSGAQRPVSGSLLLGGVPTSWKSPAAAIRDGVALIPEDRRRDGVVMSMSVGENLTLPAVGRFFRGGRLRLRDERGAAQALVEDYDVRPDDPRKPIYQLSGGNQQKVVLAKWMRLKPRLIVFDEPVQGVDVGSKAQIYRMVENAAADGAAVILIDSDFDDLARVCSMVIVMRHGRVVAELRGKDINREQILEMVYVSGEEAA